MNDTTRNSGGIGFIGLLQILFIGLKLTGHIDWSWPVVLLPMIISIGLGIIIISIVLTITAIKVIKDK